MKRDMSAHRYRRIMESHQPMTRREVVRDLARDAEARLASEEPWARRHLAALLHYETLDPSSDEAVEALAAGLGDWCGLLPQQGVMADGSAARANEWGLGAEWHFGRQVCIALRHAGLGHFAETILLELDALTVTAAELDGCFQRIPVDQAEVDRVVATARLQVRSLVRLVYGVLAARNGSFRSKRSGRPKRIVAAHDERLMARWREVGGRGGKTRKDFCRDEGITIPQFLKVQDRCRKRRQRSGGSASGGG